MGTVSFLLGRSYFCFIALPCFFPLRESCHFCTRLVSSFFFYFNQWFLVSCSSNKRSYPHIDAQFWVCPGPLNIKFSLRSDGNRFINVKTLTGLLLVLKVFTAVHGSSTAAIHDDAHVLCCFRRCMKMELPVSSLGKGLICSTLSVLFFCTVFFSKYSM